MFPRQTTRSPRLRQLAILGVPVALAGCVVLPSGGPPSPNLSLILEESLTIPANFAHTKFQGGRQVSGVSRYEPWCELETDQVSEKPQRVEPGSFRVRSISQAFIKDYIGRAPALLVGFGCSDLVFEETTLWMDPGTSPQVLYLRCFAPYTNCRFGPPLSLEQMAQVVGPSLRFDTDLPGFEADPWPGAEPARLP